MRRGVSNGGVAYGLVLCLALMLAACGDPLSEVPRLEDVPLAENSGRADALPPETARKPVTNDTPQQGLLGLFGAKAATAKEEPEGPKPGRPPRPGAPDAREVPLGTKLPYGQIARVCGVPNRKLGKKIEGYPERGAKYVLYDSAPGTTAAHTFYITGFKDRCARQFTAALVVFGSPESYEQIHYGPSGKDLPVSTTDKAYERLKSRVCRVRKGKPCGSKMRILARDTVFVSVYERFGSNPRWKNILLHDGEVVAVDLKN